jgi:hypothetical protein
VPAFSTVQEIETDCDGLAIAGAVSTVGVRSGFVIVIAVASVLFASSLSSRLSAWIGLDDEVVRAFGHVRQRYALRGGVRLAGRAREARAFVDEQKPAVAAVENGVGREKR